MTARRRIATRCAVSVALALLAACGASDAGGGGGVPTGSFSFGVALRPGGAYLYATDFGANLLHGFGVDANGHLTPLAGSPFDVGAGAASLLIDASGRFAYVADHAAGTIGLFARDASTGSLSPLGPPAVPARVTPADLILVP